LRREEEPTVPNELKGLYRLGGGALAASGLLFLSLGILDFLAGAPPSGGAEIVAWAASRTPFLAATSEILFVATILLVPAVIALYRSLESVDRAKAATGCGIVAVVIPVIAMLLIVHGRLVYPVFGLRASTPEAVALVVAIFYGGMHAVSLMMAAATFFLSLAMRRSAFGARIVYLGYAAALLDVAGGYPYAIGPIPTLVCQAVFAAWFIAVGLRLYRIG
jgi:hypothetical protein